MENYNSMPTKVIKVKTDNNNINQSHGLSFHESPRDSYVINLNDPESNALKGFPNNYIRTTKYTILTFVPKNLFEQFRRLSNFYFLTVVIVQLIPQITPLIPVTSILPLVFVLCVTAIKEAVEDFYRHKADKKNNMEMFKVLRSGGELEDVLSQDLKAGDIVYVEKNQPFPSDLIILASSLDDGICYVETANLDGETNLKQRKALDVTSRSRDPETLSNLRGAIQCESPNERLYQYSGRLVLVHDDNSKSVYALNHNQFLHRSAKLRNTAFVYGVIVYAGEDTKLFLNQQPPPSKFSNVERLLNRFILGVFIFQMAICLIMAILSGFFESNTASHMGYLGVNTYTIPVYGLRNFFTYFVLFNTMIPISLWVTLELVKVGQAKFMAWDEQMHGMQPKTSNLNEDLGRIQHIFSDKTGTLTENLMKFNKCSVNGIVYDEKAKPGGLQAKATYPTTPESEAKPIRDFLSIMALCHTVVPELNEATGKISYNSQSPDETSLVDIARENGYIFLRRQNDTIVVEEFGIQVNYKILAVLEFTSSRRRMSVIVENPDGNILLLCKGADMVIYERLVDGYAGLRDTTSDHLKSFSRDGLRTLVFAIKELPKQEYDDWKDIYHQAITSIDNREEKVEAACEIIENDLNLLGCTAIEDKLQDEVPETIHYLLEAGIQLWVLTGDKQETAINIGYSSRLLTPDMDLIVINADTSEQCGDLLKHSLEKYCYKYYNPDDGIITQEATDEEPKLLGLVIDGHSLSFALHDHTEAFLNLGKACKSVICCRVTPLQKALVVRVVKQGENRISCAIGDGANDVSMIQEAHVGIGIFGKEGTQAALASDYALHQFKHLKRLLCIHGRYSYIRVTGIIQYSFYKNMSFTLCMLYFSFYNGYTGQTLYDSWIITFFNIIFSSLPPLVYGLFEKDLNDDIIYKHPETYKRMQKGNLFTRFTFAVWILSSIWHSVVIYFGTVLVFSNDVIFSSGRNLDLWAMGTIASTISIAVVNLRIAIEVKTWNILTHIAIWGTLLAYVATLLVYSAFSGLNPGNMYFIFYMILSSPSFYFILILLTVVSLLPDFTVKYVYRQYWPEDWQILRERYNVLKEVSEFVAPTDLE